MLLSGFFFEGRGRPVVVGVKEEVEARREERVEVKAALEGWVVLEGLEVRGRGRP